MILSREEKQELTVEKLVEKFHAVIYILANMSYNIAMKMANIEDFKNNLSYFISIVEKGEEIEVCKRNIPVAKVLPVNRVHENKTKLGCGRGTVQFAKADLTEPFIPERSWDMHT